MSVQFQYAGLPPAMARKMEAQGMPTIPQNASPDGQALPQVPAPQGMQMPQVPQMQQQQRGLPSIQQYMPQGMQGMQSGNPYMPQGMQASQPGTNPYMPNAANQYMPQGMQDQNSTVFNNIMQQMSQSGQGRRQAPQGNNMGMGQQDVDNPGGGGSGTKHSGLGSLSAKYESNGRADVIANNKGDLGGASYGAYQLSTTSGNAKAFANQYGGSLKGKSPGTAAFNAAWKAEAKKNPEGFLQAQHAYIQKTHYAPSVSNIKQKTGLDVSKMSKALQDVVWSVGVQHGTGGAGNLFRNAGVKSGMSDAQIIRAVYKERKNVAKYFGGSPKNIRDGVYNRFVQEEKQALAMLGV